MKKMKYLGEGIAKYVKRRITQSTAPRRVKTCPFRNSSMRIHDCPGMRTSTRPFARDAGCLRISAIDSDQSSFRGPVLP